MITFREFLERELIPEQVNEASLQRVYAHTKSRNIGIVTAHRGGLPPEENNRRNAELQDSIKKAGYGYLHVKGRYIENHGTPEARAHDEKGYLVIGKKGADGGALRKFLTKQGEKYDQDAVLHKAHDVENAHLIGTNDAAFPGRGNSVDVGKWHPNRAGVLHSLHAGKPFTFESLHYSSPLSFSVRVEQDYMGSEE